MAAITPQEAQALQVIYVAPARRCLAPVASAALGYTPKAMDRKREEGYWLEGVHWYRAPDGRVHYDIEAITKWVVEG